MLILPLVAADTSFRFLPDFRHRDYLRFRQYFRITLFADSQLPVALADVVFLS